MKCSCRHPKVDYFDDRTGAPICLCGGEIDVERLVGKQEVLTEEAIERIHRCRVAATRGGTPSRPRRGA